jgi:PKD repeat protein
MNLEELFRYKLENSEITPDAGVGNILMRKLAFKEFMRFNPSRFNIYYLAGIAAAVAVTILVLTSNTGNVINHTTDDQPDMSVSTDSISVQRSIKLKSIKMPAGKTTTTSGKIESPVQRRQEIKENVTQTVNNSILPGSDTIRAEAGIVNKPVILSDNNKLLMENKTEVIKPFIALFDLSVQSGCSPLKVRFINKSVSFSLCKWSFGDGGTSDAANPEWIFDFEGEYKIILKISNTRGEEAVASALVKVHPRPQARFEITPEKPVLPDDQIRFLNYSKNAVRFKWEFGDGIGSNAFEPDHKYTKYGSYDVRLIAFSQSGCTDTALVKNAFSESGCNINFPNAFIPGTDGPVGGFYSAKSDEAARIFHPTTSGVTEYHLKIFSKLGIVIFESNDVNRGWDGYYKDRLCEPGVYVWKVRGTYKNGEPFVKMGDVTLLKN